MPGRASPTVGDSCPASLPEAGPAPADAGLPAPPRLPGSTFRRDLLAGLTVAALALLVGACLLVAGVIRLGWVADYFSRAVLIGYLHGVAVMLIIGQLAKLLGLHGTTVVEDLTKAATAAVNLAIGTAIGSLVSSIARSAVRVVNA
ncbi:MAG TPA: SulP family inorganic anion transporter [Actinomycetota bacterium]|nr:SulP family inorganic anion transporter [Actinomycetota bacterium]